MTLSYENLLPLSMYRRNATFQVDGGNVYNFLSFQDAFHYLVQAFQLKGKTVLVPGFYCPDTLADMRKHGLNVVLCRCDHQRLDVDMRDFTAKLAAHKPEVVIIYNFFGKNSRLYQEKAWREHVLPDVLLISDFAHSLMPLHPLEFLSSNHVYIDSTRKSTNAMMAHMVTPPDMVVEPRYITRRSCFRWRIRTLFAAKTLLLRGARLLHAQWLGNMAMKLYIRHDGFIGTPMQALAGFGLDAWLYRHMDFEAIRDHRQLLFPLYQAALKPLVDAGYIALVEIAAEEAGNLCFFPMRVTNVESIPRLAAFMERQGFWVDRLWDFDAMEGMEAEEKLWAKSIMVCPLTVQTTSADIQALASHLSGFIAAELAAAMQDNPQLWTVTSILEESFGEVLVATGTTVCLRAGHFYFVEGEVNAKVGETILATMGAEGIIISGVESWLAWFKRHVTEHKAEIVQRWRYRYTQSAAPLQATIAGVEVKNITPTLYAALQTTDWANDVFDSYNGAEDYFQRGFGCVALKDGVPVSLCTSFSHSRLGVEIEVDTAPEHQGKGLARLVSSAFIQESLKRGLTPLWDASNPPSAKVAEKLGFTLEHAYAALALQR